MTFSKLKRIEIIKRLEEEIQHELDELKKQHQKYCITSFIDKNFQEKKYELQDFQSFLATRVAFKTIKYTQKINQLIYHILKLKKLE